MKGKSVSIRHSEIFLQTAKQLTGKRKSRKGCAINTWHWIFFPWRINFKLPIKYEEINVRIELIWITVVHFASGTIDCGGPFGKYSIRSRDNPRQGQSEELNVTTFHRFPFRLNFLKNSVFRIFRPLLLFLTSFFLQWNLDQSDGFLKAQKNCIYVFFNLCGQKLDET